MRGAIDLVLKVGAFAKIEDSIKTMGARFLQLVDSV